MQALYVLCLCGIVVTCKEPHKVDIFLLCVASLYFKGGDMMGQKDDVLTDDLRKVTMKLLQ